MDIVLEGSPMDGIETARKLGQIMDVPVIFVTAYSDKKTLARVKGTEPYAYILKPFNERELAFAIELALHRSRLDKEIKKHDTLLLAISFAIEWFLRRHASVPSHDTRYEKNLSAGIMEILEHIGFAVHAASVCIFRMNPGTEGKDGATVQYLWVDPGRRAGGRSRSQRPSHSRLRLSCGVRFSGVAIRSQAMCKSCLGASAGSLRSGEFHRLRCSRSLRTMRSGDLWAFPTQSPATGTESEMEALQIAGNLIGAVLE